MRSSTSSLFAAMVLLPLIACNSDHANDDLSASGVATDGQNYSALLSRAHRYVYVARGTGNLSEPDRAGLANFIAEQADGRNAAVHAALTGPVPLAELTPLGKILVADGVDPDKIEYNPNRQPEGQVPNSRAGMVVIDVATERWKPRLPLCPDHSQLSIVDSTNPDSSNYGCTTATNLGVMISDPRDLVAGETGGHTDAGLTTAAIERLEQNKLKGLTDASVKGGS
jgi:type IV pilus biogenesis protein CpaD/CtpE